MPKKIVGREAAFGPIPARLHPIFRDRDELSAATDLSAEINAALEASMFLVVLCSPASAASHWVNEEIKAFKRLHGEDRVRAIIVDGEPFSVDAATECFPEALRFRFDQSGAMTDTRAEPIAADIRPEGDGKKYAISKLVAGLTGAGLDELVQREQMRRNARMRVIAASLGVLMLVLSGLTFDALRQRNIARLAQADAEFQRDEAQDLVEYMLTDLRDRLNAVGRLDVLESVGDRLAQSFTKQDMAKLDANALGRRARVQLLLGEVENMGGDLDAALIRYRQAAETTAEQLRRDPDGAQRIFDHSQSVFWVGYIAWQRGDAEEARGWFVQYHDQARRLVEIEPDNDDYQAELDYANSNLGTLEMGEGNAAAAEEYFRKSLAVSSHLAAKYPGDVDRTIAHGQSFAWLADALYAQIRLHDALQAREFELSLYSRALSTNPGHASLEELSAVAHYSVAFMRLSSGQPEMALIDATVAASHAERLVKLDPENTEYVDRAAVTHSFLGELYAILGQRNEAHSSLESSAKFSEILSEKDNSVVRWREKFSARTTLVLARLAEADLNSSKAIGLYSKVATDLHDIANTEEFDSVAIRIYCSALAGRARLSREFSDGWRDIIATLGAESKNLSPEVNALLGEALFETGQLEEAKRFSQKLHTAGFRHPDFINLLTAHPELRAEGLDAAPK